MITLTKGGTTLELDPDFWWSDEFSWSPVRAVTSYSLTGALLVDESVAQAGRPITLQPDAPNGARMSGAMLRQIQGWAAEPGAVLTLALRGELFSVMFRRDSGPCIEAVPTIFTANPAPGGLGDWYRVTLRFIEVQE